MMEVIRRKRQFCKFKLLSIVRRNKFNTGKIIKQCLTLGFKSRIALLLIVLIKLELEVVWAKVISVEVKCYILLY